MTYLVIFLVIVIAVLLIAFNAVLGIGGMNIWTFFFQRRLNGKEPK
jgi:uncharacterized protein HemY